MSKSIENQMGVSLATWYGAGRDLARQFSVTLDADQQREIARSLSFSHTPRERLLRLLFTDLLNALPSKLYRRFTDFLKQLRGRSGATPDIDFKPGLFMNLASEIAELVEPKPQTLTVLLTHDVDTRECAEFWPEVARIEEKSGVRSTYNVLTRGPYKLDQGWIREAKRRGFEIGLHGDTHDMAIGFRKTQETRERLQACRDLLGPDVIGYRAPALAVSEPLLAILAELGFRYDSSIKVSCFYSTGVPACLPYLYGTLSIWEFPLAIADDGLFRDLSLSEDDALRVVRRMIRSFGPFGGLLVFNGHPGILREHMGFYRSLLDCLSNDPSISVVRACDLANQLDRRTLSTQFHAEPKLT